MASIGAEITAGEETVTLSSSVKMGHKIALRAIAKDQKVLKYGQIIGFTTKSAEPGDWLHSHNLYNGEFTLDHASATQTPPPQNPSVLRTNRNLEHRLFLLDVNFANFLGLFKFDLTSLPD